MKHIFYFFLFTCCTVTAQNKKPLTHEVYDGWKSAGERMISNNGKLVVYAVNPQEGDGELIIQNLVTHYKKIIPRGYNALITDDSRFVVFKIKPLYQATRQAKIKKKKGDELPKDSLGIVQDGADSVIKIVRVSSFKAPEKSAGFVAYQLEKPMADSTKKKLLPDSLKTKMDLLVKLADSVIGKSIDSIKGNIARERLLTAVQKTAREIVNSRKTDDENTTFNRQDAEGDDAIAPGSRDGADLVIRNLNTSKEKTIKQVSEYFFNKKGTSLLVETAKSSKDTNSVAYLLLYHLLTDKTDTLLKKFNEAKGYIFDEEGSQLAFIAERDSSEKALQKFFKLWYYKPGMDSATILADKNMAGMALGSTVGEYGDINFSKDGKKLFFGTAIIKPPKDTNLVDFELARLDVWNYKDDYLQPQQLKQMETEMRRSYRAVINLDDQKITQLGSSEAENTTLVNEGNADYVLATTTKGSRIESQWTGNTKQTGYIVNTTDGKSKLIKQGIQGYMLPSPAGKFIYWYDAAAKNYFVYNVADATVKNISGKIKVPLFDTKNDVPDYPSSAGVTGWTADDKYLLVNDEYDIWQLDPNGTEQPKNITNGWGRKNNTSLTYVNTDLEKRFINTNDTILLKCFSEITKYAGFCTATIAAIKNPELLFDGPWGFTNPLKAKNAAQYVFQKSSISESELFTTSDFKNLQQLTNIAVQQQGYNWLTASLVKWKMFDGKMSEGILYKPENFDPAKKYPVIFYFYERNSDGLFNYRQPAPSASTINIPWFVSNGYLVFDPNIYYKTGEPGQSAFNSVVSAAKYLSKMAWVDSNHMGIQGQSWGGYQVAYIVTRTSLFKAAGAGAPVANMTSAYGGIRWGPGINRQFQYEKTQSRIGATLWQRPDLYIKNSPLFAADKITTPLLIMHNDADGSVPWYQGIELFTALKRLGKKVWMLQYNGEDHNLVERRNRKDLSVRLGQFFDYYLKEGSPAKWIKDGVPATDKGKTWGLETAQ